MTELSPGSGVHVFESQVQQAIARKSPTSCVSFLLNCFYTNQEMAGMNLTGPHGKAHPDSTPVGQWSDKMDADFLR